MPKLERLDWVSPLSEGNGVTLTDDPEANQLLAGDPNALLVGVLCDSQFQTRRAFAIPLRLKQRLGHFDIRRIAAEPDAVREAFTTKPALHRFPNRCAEFTVKLAGFIVETYDGDGSRVWTECRASDELGRRLLELPAFGEQKADWTVGMLGRMGVLTFSDWDGYRVGGVGRS
jgi:uncharacterized HhH-GPD family protein